MRNTASIRPVRKYICFLLACLSALTLSAEPLLIKIDTDARGAELYNFWNTTVTTVAPRFARADEHAALRREMPFADYVNCVRLLGGRTNGEINLFKGIDAKNEAICDFTEAKAILRGVMKCGFTPRIVLDNVPFEMSRTNKMETYGNTQPPANFDVWHSFIRQFATMLVREFGRKQVSQWRFRVGTEPDLYPGHWSGTKAEFLQHYDYTVDAVTSVIPEANIGPGNILNPAEQPPHPKMGWWGLDLIDHCATGTNYKTGAIGTRLCFFAFSWYGKVGKSVDTFDLAMKRVRERLQKYPHFSNVPVEVHEFSVLHDERNKFLFGGDATEWAASWMAAVADKVYEHDVKQVFQWATTYRGLPHPRTHVFTLLQHMEKGKRLPVSRPASGKIGCLASARNNRMDLLIYRHEKERDDGVAQPVQIILSGRQRAGRPWRVKKAGLIDRDHSNYIRQFCSDANAAGIQPLPDMGIYQVHIGRQFGDDGEKFFQEHREKYETLSRLAPLNPLPPLSKIEKNEFTLNLNLAGHSVVYIRLER